MIVPGSAFGHAGVRGRQGATLCGITSSRGCAFLILPRGPALARHEEHPMGKLTRIVGAAVLGVIVLGMIVNSKDIARYVRMSTM